MGRPAGTTWRPEGAEAQEVKIADTIRRIESADSAFSTAVIEDITVEHGEKVAHVVRPYIHTADFSYTGGVLTYIGVERYKVPVADVVRYYEILSRKALR